METKLWKQAFDIGVKAKDAGLGVALHQGKYQFQIITPKAGGNCDVEPVTGWLSPECAIAIDLKQAMESKK